MEKRSTIDQIEVTRDGSIQLRIAKEIVDDDGSILSSAWHRTMFTPGCDIDAQMAVVNENLTLQLGFPAVDTSGVDRIKSHAELAWTPEVIAAYNAALPEL